MNKNLKGKTVAIIAILVMFCYGIFGIPHGLSPAALKDAMLSRIRLGLDLKGGTRLVLLVHVADAVVSTTDREVEQVQDDLQKAGVTGVQVHKLDPNDPKTITIAGIPSGKASDVRSLLEGNDYANYDLASNPDGSERLSLKQSAVSEIETHALDQSLETINDRINTLGVAETNVQKYGVGDNELVVELPGISDPDKVEDAIHNTSKLAVYAVVSGPYESDQAAMTALSGPPGRHAGAWQRDADCSGRGVSAGAGEPGRRDRLPRRAALLGRQRTPGPNVYADHRGGRPLL